MSTNSWDKKFLASTRGQVVELLRRGEASVSELAEALNLTDNAVRSHLSTLERDELVRQTGKRPGLRKPETLYGITAAAEQLFPKAYHLLLSLVLDALNARLSPDETVELLREVGRKIGQAHTANRDNLRLRQKVDHATEVLNDLGGLAEVQEIGGQFKICGFSCPLADAVAHNPEVCQLAEALMAEVIGAPVQEICDRSETPKCAFLVTPTE